MEAADDITYTVIDFEDAHRLKILTNDEIRQRFYEVISCINRPEDDLAEIDSKLRQFGNDNEKISYLRSRTINSLILEVNDIFITKIDKILAGEFSETLVGELKKSCSAFLEIEKISYEKIYNHHTVIELELAGYNVMYELLNLLIPPVLKKTEKRNKFDKKAMELIPNQYGSFDDRINAYDKCMSIIDFVSGMTDLFATELYRKIRGIEIAKHD